LIAFAVALSGGCSTSSQSQIDGAVRSTLAAATPTTPPNPELTIYVTHIGTTKSHSQLGLLGGIEDNLRLVVRILDGANRTELYLPPEGVPARTVEPGKKTAISMDRIQIQPESNSITLEVIAYQEDDFSGLKTLMGLMSGNDLELADLITEPQSSSQDVQAKYIGHFQIFLSPASQWGRGTYEAVGDADLRLWLEIESDGVTGQKYVGQPFPTPTPVPTQTPISDLIGKWQLVENNELLTNGSTIEFHPNGTISLEVPGWFGTSYEKGSYSSVPTGGVHLTISNGFLNYIDSDYEMRIVGDYLYLEYSSFGFSYGHKWVRVNRYLFRKAAVPTQHGDTQRG